MKIEKFKKNLVNMKKKIKTLFNRIDMDNENNVHNVIILMLIVEKVKYLNTKYRENIVKQYDDGTLKIMTDASKFYKNIYNLIKGGADSDTVIDLLIETYIEFITVLFSDDSEDFFTNYKDMHNTLIYLYQKEEKM